MKKLLSLVCFLLTFSAFADNVAFRFTYQLDGSPDTNYCIVRSIDPAVLGNGNISGIGLPRRYSLSTNGQVTISNMSAGCYAVTNPYTRAAVAFRVYNDGNTSTYALSNLVISGYKTMATVYIETNNTSAGSGTFDYNDLTNTPALGSASLSNATDFASLALAQRMSNQMVKRWNVMEYGASGTGNKDLDSPAFATAWSNAFKYGGIVYAPKGLYTDTNSYNPIPVYATNAGNYHTAQTGSELFLEGDGKDATIIQVAITNSVYMWCYGQIPGLKGVGFVNVGGGSNDCLIATNTPGVAGLISDCRWDGFRTRYSQAVNIAAMDGLRVRGCEWRDNYIGIRVGGYSDGCEVDGRADACRVGLVIGGYFGGTSVTRSLGNRINLSGNGNGYHIVVGASSACNVLSGYSEHSSNALVAIGYPSGVFINESATGPGTTTMVGLQQGVATSTDVFCQLFTKPTSLQIIGCSGGNAVVSAAAGADGTPIQIVGGLWFGTNLITTSTGSGVPKSGSWTEWSYNWNSIGTYGISSNTWDTAGFYYGHNGQFGVLKANSAFVTNDLRVVSGAFHGTVGATNLVGTMPDSMFYGSNVWFVPDIAWNSRPAGDSFMYWSEGDQRPNFKTNLNAGAITGVLPSGTVAINSMVAGSVLGNNGTSRLWTNSVGPLTIASNSASGSLALTVNGNLTANTGYIEGGPDLRLGSGGALKVGTISILGFNSSYATIPSIPSDRGYAISSTSTPSGVPSVIWASGGVGIFQLRTNNTAASSSLLWPNITVNTNSGLFLRAHVAFGMSDTNTLSDSGSVINKAGITNGIVTAYSYVTPTNSATHVPDYSKSATLYVTNDGPLLLSAPVLDLTKYQEFVQFVQNTGGSTIDITPPNSITVTNGTLNCTNGGFTQLKWQAYGNVFTNLYVTPIK